MYDGRSRRRAIAGSGRLLSTEQRITEADEAAGDSARARAG